MKILLADYGFNLLGGAERAARDLALEMRARGHSVLAFRAPIGKATSVAASAGIPVVWDLAKRDFEPDIIHGQHHLDTMIAITGIPDVPAIYYCHGAGFADTPPVHPRIYRYVTVTETLAQRMVTELNLPPSSIEVVPNSVDLKRFTTVRTPAVRPRRALAYGHQIRPNRILAAVTDVATAQGLVLDRIGRMIGKEIENPEEILPTYDIVFASGKSAIDALASGCAVIILGLQGCGEMVREENFDRYRKANFTIPVNSPPPSAERIAEEIARYDPESAAAVTGRLRHEADLDLVVDRMEQIYRDAIRTHASAKTLASTAQRSSMNYIRNLVPMVIALDTDRDGEHQLSLSVARTAAITETAALRNDQRQFSGSFYPGGRVGRIPPEAGPLS